MADIERVHDREAQGHSRPEDRGRGWVGVVLQFSKTIPWAARICWLSIPLGSCPKKCFTRRRPIRCPRPTTGLSLSTQAIRGDGAETNDYFAALYVRFTADGFVYVDDSYLAVAPPDTAVEMTAALCERHQDAQIVVFEANAGGRYVAKCIKERLEAKGLQFPVVFTRIGLPAARNSTTPTNWAASQLPFGKNYPSRKIKLRDTPWNRVLYRQLRGFPTEKARWTGCFGHRRHRAKTDSERRR